MSGRDSFQSGCRYDGTLPPVTVAVHPSPGGLQFGQAGRRGWHSAGTGRMGPEEGHEWT